MKLEVQATDREENKQIALGTSKLNYLDPRISVAWSVDAHKRAQTRKGLVVPPDCVGGRNTLRERLEQ